MLIVIEGPDGCGKGTVADLLANEIRGVKLAFPERSSKIGQVIDRHLKGEGRLAPIEFQALQIVNRLENAWLLENCAGNYTPGGHLVLERYNPSAMVYGQLDGLPFDWLEKVHASLPVADVNILLDVEPEVGMARRAARDGDAAPELYEGKIATARKVRDLYRDLWRYKNDPKHWDGGDWFVVDAAQPVLAVLKDCIDLIRGAGGWDT